ncbi:MAG: hypothetical protein DHS20C18_24430 [Saprospiraceae bacterium]|nr:MAG: hypothetical protein DHS20C18_24430 [Saprospiraceae bacterium]
MKILGIIPARGGSKGVPRKNIKQLAGKPLIAYTIQSGKASKHLNHLIVSTEDEEIAAISRKLKADVPFLRPNELAQDSTPTLPVLIHALNYYSQLGQYFDAVCILQTTTPFRPAKMIDNAIEKFISTGADTLISLRPVPIEYNPHWVFEETTGELLKISTGERQIIPRRQELPPAFHRDGMLYLVKSDVLLKQNTIFGNTITGYLTQGEAVNIDTFEDWNKAEELATKLYN